jgi:hypothetical protein
MASITQLANNQYVLPNPHSHRESAQILVAEAAAVRYGAWEALGCPDQAEFLDTKILDRVYRARTADGEQCVMVEFTNRCSKHDKCESGCLLGKLNINSARAKKLASVAPGAVCTPRSELFSKANKDQKDQGDRDECCGTQSRHEQLDQHVVLFLWSVLGCLFPVNIALGRAVKQKLEAKRYVRWRELAGAVRPVMKLTQEVADVSDI